MADPDHALSSPPPLNALPAASPGQGLGVVSPTPTAAQCILSIVFDGCEPTVNSEPKPHTLQRAKVIELVTPVATPCRASQASPPGEPAGVELHHLASVEDDRVPRPEAGGLHLSQAAIDQRRRRLMTPTSTGKLKVSKDVVEMFQSGGAAKQNVYRMFQAAGFEPERGG